MAAAIVAVFCISSVLGIAKGIPENPIGQQTDNIRTETMVASGGYGGSEQDDEDKEIKKEKKKEKEENKKKSDTESDKKDPQKDSRTGKDNDAKNDEGDNGDDGDGGDETGGQEDHPPLPPEEAEGDPEIITDLSSGTVTEKKLKNGRFGFYAYLSKHQKDAELKVKIMNDETSVNGRYLTGEGKKGRDFSTELAHEYNYITLYLKRSGEITKHITYVIRYVYDEADEDKPEVGEHPPLITTNIDDRTAPIKNRNFILKVSAKTYKGKYLPYDNIRVTFDGKALRTSPTGAGTYEYDLHFENPAIGDRESHEVTVLAWDSEGNSRYRTYTVIYEFADEDQEIGTATVNIDATTLGLGVIASGFKYEIKQDEPASAAVLAAMDEYGFKAGYSGTAKAGFYLRSLSAGYIAKGSSIPSNLWEKVKDDGINLTGQHSSNSISEFDYTEGSGWMYTVDGVLYPGRGLSNYYLEDGDVLTLRFTLAYGKDLGGTSSRGRLSSYCGIWSNGSYQARHHMGSYETVEEATCENEGKKEAHCQVKGCRETDEQILPALGHSYKVTERVEPTATEDGHITHKCSRCGKTYRETLPATGEKDKPDPPDKPDTPDQPDKPDTPEGEDEKNDKEQNQENSSGSNINNAYARNAAWRISLQSFAEHRQQRNRLR